jgi:hypothetical protein
MDRLVAANLCLPILGIQPHGDSKLVASSVNAVQAREHEHEHEHAASSVGVVAGNTVQVMEHACTLLVDMITGNTADELSQLLLDLARDQACALAARVQRSGSSSAGDTDDGVGESHPHEGSFLLLRELLRTTPATPKVRRSHARTLMSCALTVLRYRHHQLVRFRDDVLAPLLALLWTDDSAVRRVVFHELLPAFFARPQDASPLHLEVNHRAVRLLTHARTRLTAVHVQCLWRELHRLWLAGHRNPRGQHRAYEGDAYLLMAKFIEHFLAASPALDLRTDERFWTFLQVRACSPSCPCTLALLRV